VRDYPDLISRLRAEGSPLSEEAAEAVQEFCDMAGRMTSLGVDLEAQIQEDMQPDLFAMHGETRELNMLYSRDDIESLSRLYPGMSPFMMVPVKIIGESWFVFDADGGVQEYLSEDAALQAMTDAVKEE
jgi:hypothetical protein